jgi:hypothetical protein
MADISFEDFRIKSVMLKKSTEGITSTAAAIECGTRGFCSFVNV